MGRLAQTLGRTKYTPPPSAAQKSARAKPNCRPFDAECTSSEIQRQERQEPLDSESRRGHLLCRRRWTGRLNTKRGLQMRMFVLEDGLAAKHSLRSTQLVALLTPIASKPNVVVNQISMCSINFHPVQIVQWARPNPSVNRTFCGGPVLAVISFSAKPGPPQNAGYLER